MTTLTLLRQQHPLAEAAEQRRLLSSLPQIPDFATHLQSTGCRPLRSEHLSVLQVNVGKVCNQTCRHCHVDAGPDRRESMSRDVAEHCLRVLKLGGFSTLDITGGAPEMNVHFRWLVSEARSLGCRVIDRCNLTILVTAGYEDLPEFLAEHQVEIVASLPCYLEENVDRQRGDRVFERSLTALRRLNSLGYGTASSDAKDGRPGGSGLDLTLVFNPVGPSLPPDQYALEQDYRRELDRRYGIQFSRLFTITNMPISRFLLDLQQSGRTEEYLKKLVDAYNPQTVAGLMCRTTLSVDWTGRLFDCDFNQMLELSLAAELPQQIQDVNEQSIERLINRPISVQRHCFGCTAGAGSSCQGTVTG